MWKTSRGRKGHEAEYVSYFYAPADGRNDSYLSENIKVFLVLRNKVTMNLFEIAIILTYNILQLLLNITFYIKVFKIITI